MSFWRSVTQVFTQSWLPGSAHSGCGISKDNMENKCSGTSLRLCLRPRVVVGTHIFVVPPFFAFSQHTCCRCPPGMHPRVTAGCTTGVHKMGAQETQVGARHVAPAAPAQPQPSMLTAFGLVHCVLSTLQYIPNARPTADEPASCNRRGTSRKRPACVLQQQSRLQVSLLHTPRSAAGRAFHKFMCT